MQPALNYIAELNGRCVASKQNRRCKDRGVTGAVVFIDKQPPSPIRSLCDVTQVEMFTDEEELQRFSPPQLLAPAYQNETLSVFKSAQHEINKALMQYWVRKAGQKSPRGCRVKLPQHCVRAKLTQHELTLTQCGFFFF